MVMYSLDSNYCSLFLTFLVITTSRTSDAQTYDNCNWKKSGLSHGPRDIEKVHLSCESGSVEWMYPTAALHIQFQFPLTTAEFSICFLPERNFAGASLYKVGKDNPHKSTSIKLIYADPALKEHHRELPEHVLNEFACVNSTGGSVMMLLMATTPKMDISRRIAAFKYELIPIERKKHRGHEKHKNAMHKKKRMLFSGTMEDCLPCSDRELLETYCSADFVARGHILSVEDDNNYKWRNIEFLADHVIHDASLDRPVFRSLSSVAGFNVSRAPQSKGGRVRITQVELQKLQRGFFRIPGHCGSPALEETQEFMLMANYNFGSGWVQCLPTWSHMKRVIKKSTAKDHSSRKYSNNSICDYSVMLQTSNNA